MTKTSYVCGISAAVLCLVFTSVHAEDAAEPKPSQPPVTQDQKEQTKPKPKEEATNPNEPNSNASKEEPECK